MLQQILTNYLLPLAIYGSITGLANLALAHKSQIETWNETHPKYAGFLKLMRAVGFDPWSLVAALSLWAKGKLPDAQQNGAKAVAALVEAEQAPTPKHSNLPPLVGVLLIACLSFHANACAVFGSGGSFWPKFEHCAPTPAALVSQVASILLAGGDYESALKQVALKDGAGVVECAVAAAVNSLAANVGAGESTGAAEARGKAFLLKVSK